MTKINLIEELIRKNNGIITSKDLRKNNIAMQFIKIMLEKGELEKVARGVYVLPNVMEDEYFTLQSVCPKAIFSNETALFLHGMSDRLPLVFDVTLPNGYNTSNLKKTRDLNIFRCNTDVYDLGICTVRSPHGKNLKVYNIERTICDIIKNKKKIDKQVFVDAIRIYAKKKDKDLTRLNKYAKIFGIEENVRTYLEVLL